MSFSPLRNNEGSSMHMRLQRCLGENNADRRVSGRFLKGVAIVAMLTLAGMVLALGSPGPAAAADKPTITKDVDANGDAVFNDSENVSKSVTYPLTVTFRLTVDAGSFSSHKIVSITDSTT